MMLTFLGFVGKFVMLVFVGVINYFLFMAAVFMFSFYGMIFWPIVCFLAMGWTINCLLSYYRKTN